MNRYEAFKATLFRHDSAGRAVYVPSKLQGVWIVPEGERERVAATVYRARWQGSLVFIACLALTSLSGLWVLGMLAGVLLEWQAQRTLVATLERSSDTKADLPPIDRSARRLARARVFGRRYFWDEVLAGTLFAALALFVLVGPIAHQVSTLRHDGELFSTRTYMLMLLAFGLWNIASGAYFLRLLGTRDAAVSQPA
jgi:hypothetical protein